MRGPEETVVRVVTESGLGHVTKQSSTKCGFDCTGFVAAAVIGAEARFYLISARHCDPGYVWATIFGAERYLKGLRRLEPPVDGVVADLSLTRLPRVWLRGREGEALPLSPADLDVSGRVAEAHVFDGALPRVLPLRFGDGTFLVDCPEGQPPANNWRPRPGFVYGTAAPGCATPGMSGGAVLAGSTLAGVLVERSGSAVAISPLHLGLWVRGATLSTYLLESDPDEGAPEAASEGSVFTIR